MADPRNDDRRKPAEAMPSNSVDLESYTTRPGYGEINITDLENKSPEEVLSILTRDFRLGNLDPKLHDTDWFWDRLDLSMHIILLRDGRMSRASVACLTSAAALTETSLSINGFLRKIQKTMMRNERRSWEGDTDGGGFNFFGRRKRKKNTDFYGEDMP